ncbi:hypothetical protein [Aeromicrobium wangtongii]|uniref:Uncharacterized protein n=1 Tax=Aeromicrobium wangtongii TaxID=2969247 RepID=A0ABY5M631_9ACTN|nr:hypothetical protein [Aeromicrobium wangtongii]MCD9198424.1 hypothetical protein [Aeromicrobium wangtongii]MCL3818891.1 hypothetical protein [Aeromicrobium wangtongii]UUP12453.1 hypothetical protein NQV15_11370 [Aeromicrobium wangtongii]
MPSVEYEATPSEVRKFALLQIVLTAVFFVLLFFMLGGDDAPFPPVWLTVLLVVLVGAGAVMAERVWLSSSPLPADADPDEARRDAVGVFAAQTVRKLTYCEAPLLIAVLVAFVTDHGGWPLVIAGFPGLLVLTWELWPSLRNTSLTAAMLDSKGADSQLVESFRE